MNPNRIIHTILAPIVVCILSWLLGFDTRGYVAANVFLFSLTAGVLAWTFPYKNEF
jgi:hypothetical protein